jgi:aromatic ring-opening dioxygenase LigB subunit
MDWGTQVPLHFMGGRDERPKPIVMIAPARDLAWDAHVTAGRAIATAAEASGRRVALIASCDHGHAHDAKGPYGFSPASKEFDDRVVELVKCDALAELLRFDPAFVAEAKADSFLADADAPRSRRRRLARRVPVVRGANVLRDALRGLFAAKITLREPLAGPVV